VLGMEVAPPVHVVAQELHHQPLQQRVVLPIGAEEAGVERALPVLRWKIGTGGRHEGKAWLHGASLSAGSRVPHDPDQPASGAGAVAPGREPRRSAACTDPPFTAVTVFGDTVSARIVLLDPGALGTGKNIWCVPRSLSGWTRMAMEDVAITGMGVVSPIGLNVAEAEASLRNAVSGIRLYEAPPIRKPFAAGAIPVQFEEEFPKLERPFLDRVQQMAILAARQAIAQAGLEEFSGYGERAGLYYGNVNGGTATGLEWFQQLLLEGRQRSRPWTSMAIMGNGGGAQIAIRHRITGPVITSSSACASSGVSIGEAGRAIARGDLDIAVAGGAEGSLTSLVLGTFDGTRAMAEPDPDDPSTTCRPFSKQR